MAAPHSFRSAFNGFHKDDVVRYLEYMNTKHQNQVNQLNAEIEELQSRLNAKIDAAAAAVPEQDGRYDALKAQYDELQSRYDALAAAQQAVPESHEEADASGGYQDQVRELEAYRQAERIQKEARDRAELVYFQASSVLTEATARVAGASGDITALTDQVMSQITQLQVAVSASKQALQEAAAIMGAIRPNR